MVHRCDYWLSMRPYVVTSGIVDSFAALLDQTRYLQLVCEEELANLFLEYLFFRKKSVPERNTFQSICPKSHARFSHAIQIIS